MMYSIISNETCIGFIIVSERDVAAFDHGGILIGRFPNQGAATKAVYRAANKER
jgi:hypothetical protein